MLETLRHPVIVLYFAVLLVARRPSLSLSPELRLCVWRARPVGVDIRGQSNSSDLQGNQRHLLEGKQKGG